MASEQGSKQNINGDGSSDDVAPVKTTSHKRFFLVFTSVACVLVVAVVVPLVLVFDGNVETSPSVTTIPVLTRTDVMNITTPGDNQNMSTTTMLIPNDTEQITSKSITSTETTSTTTTVDNSTADKSITSTETASTTIVGSTTDKTGSTFTVTKVSTLPTTTLPVPFEPVTQPPKVADNCEEPTANLGSCAEFDCTTDSGEIKCTQVLKTETINVTCGGENFTMISETACQCISCGEQKFYITINGRAYGSDAGVMFGSIYLNGENVAMTSFSGDFQFQIERYKYEKITLVAKDEVYNIFMTTSKTFQVENSLSQMTINIAMIEKDNTLDTLTSVDNTIDFSKPGTTAPVFMDIPANSFTYTDGSAYHGEVSIDYSFMDTASSEDFEKTPKSFFTEGGNSRLESYGMFILNARASNGESMNIEKAAIRIPKSAINNAHVGSLKLWTFNETRGEWDYESTFEETSMRVFSSSMRADNFLVGNVPVSVNKINNLDVEVGHPYCFVKVRAFKDQTQKEELYGVTVNAIYQGANGEWLSYFSKPIDNDFGACIQVPCGDKEEAVKKTYFTASYMGVDLYSLTNEDLIEASAVTAEVLNTFSYEVDEQNEASFSLVIPGNSTNDNKGPEYTETNCCGQGPCDHVKLSHDDYYFGFYRKPTGNETDMNAIQMNNEASLPNRENVPQCLSWWPNHGKYTACYIKVEIVRTQILVKISTINIGGTLEDIKDQWIGTRYNTTVVDDDGNNYACVEYKCCDNISPTTSSNGCNVLYNFVDPSSVEVDRTLVRVEPVGTSCTIQSMNSNLINDLTNDQNKNHYITNSAGDKSFYFYDATVHSYGTYNSMGREESTPVIAKQRSLSECENGNQVAVTFDCSKP